MVIKPGFIYSFVCSRSRLSPVPTHPWQALRVGAPDYSHFTRLAETRVPSPSVRGARW
jgi:hypothetical protein